MLKLVKKGLVRTTPSTPKGQVPAGLKSPARARKERKKIVIFLFIKKNKEIYYDFKKIYKNCSLNKKALNLKSELSNFIRLYVVKGGDKKTQKFIEQLL